MNDDFSELNWQYTTISEEDDVERMEDNKNCYGIINTTTFTIWC